MDKLLKERRIIIFGNLLCVFINFQARKLSLIEARDELLFFSKNYNIFQ